MKRIFSRYFPIRLQQRLDAGRVYQPDKFERIDTQPPRGFWSLIRRIWPEA